MDDPYQKFSVLAQSLKPSTRTGIKSAQMSSVKKPRKGHGLEKFRECIFFRAQKYLFLKYYTFHLAFN